tara:strand:+ start:401 stop:1192 length:792 start_codon:yes stop_codon:yes gene_type:complete
MNKKIMFFIPIYNGVDQITRVLKKMKDLDESYIFKTIIIDNQSRDGTQKQIINFFKKNKLKNQFELIQNKENYGLGGSHKIAYDYFLKSNYEYLIISQGDDQGDPKDLVIALNKELGKNIEIPLIMGSRFKNLSRIKGYSKLKILFNLMFNVFASIALSNKISDLSSGQLVVSKKALSSKFYKNFPNELWFNYYFFFYFVVNNIKYTYHSISWVEEDQISNLKIIKQIIALSKLLVKLRFKKKKYFDSLKKDKNEYHYEKTIL